MSRIVKEIGKIIIIDKVQSGTTASGSTWARQNVVVEFYGGNNSIRRLALTVSGDRTTLVEPFALSDMVQVSYIVSSREYNGKWYTNADLINIEPYVRSEKPVVVAESKPKTTPSPCPASMTKAKMICPGNNQVTHPEGLRP